MTFLPGDEKSFDFFCTGAGIDSIFLKSFVSFESDEPDITFYFPAKRSTNKLGQITCPKCVKADKVYRTVYGDGIPFKRIITNGDTVYTPIYKGKYNAGTCVDGVAKYYCGRDKIKF